MSRLLKCMVLLNSRIVKKQCTVFASGYHSTQVYGDNNASVKTNRSGPYQPVADFYAGKSIFLTGGTGFLGKVFIERLLSSCSEIDKIYVLIRAKKGSSVQQRLQDLLGNPIFTTLRSTRPEYLKKVVPIAGDVTEPELGIRPEDEQALKDNVSVVFHAAALVKFSEPMNKALDINVEGTRKVMSLSKQMKNLNIFVHISTAYSNTDKLIIDEMVYPPPRKLEDAISFAKTHSNDDEETETFLRGHANPYTFSKSLAESLVLETYKDMPTIIVRPSIVSAILRRPLPGWLDSWVAGTGTFTDVSRGLTRILHGSSKVVIDLIPVDYVCNFAIVAAAKSPRTQDLLVYNSCTSSTNPITWTGASNIFAKDSKKFEYSKYIAMTSELALKMAPDKLLGKSKLEGLPFPIVFASESPTVVSAVTFLLQTVPSFIADLWLRVTGRKPKYMKLQPRAVLLRDMLKGFTSTNFLIKSDRAQEIIAALDEKDRDLFMCDPKTIDWKEYMSVYSYGVKRYLLRK